MSSEDRWPVELDEAGKMIHAHDPSKERVVKTRKPHECHCCKMTLPAGTTCLMVTRWASARTWFGHWRCLNRGECAARSALKAGEGLVTE